MRNKSPWIEELNPKRESKKIFKDLETDVAIIGGGIAGVSSAFFMLEMTNKKVVLIEKDKLAHGATGHNAGHVAAYFERPLTDIAKEYGVALAVEGQKDLESAWELIDHMYDTAKLTQPFTKLTGHEGYSTKEQIFGELEIRLLLKENGFLEQAKIFINENLSWVKEIPEKFAPLYELVPKRKILELIESKDDQYEACESYSVGCINSARFCEGILEYLLLKYKDRFSFFEHSPVQKVIMKDTYALLDVTTQTVKAEKIILCTNGFEHIEIFNHGGLDIDTKFHHHLHGVIGYMSAYVDKVDKPTFAAEYFTPESVAESNPYFYVTRRSYDFKEIPNLNLFSLGGPGILLEDRKEYQREYEYPEEIQKELDDFVVKTYGRDEENKFEHKFSWHGLMGYTKSMIRLVGPEPKSKILLYNLGCNGLGILPSIFGGWKIAKMVSGEIFPPSIFDPK